MKIIKKQSGISLIIVLFLLGVVSALVIPISNLVSTQNVSSTYSWRNAQAYFAARSGLEYGLARIVAGSGCAGVAPTLLVQNYTVNTTCTIVGTYDEGNVLEAYSIFSLTAVASQGNFTVPDVSNRRVSATIKFP